MGPVKVQRTEIASASFFSLDKSSLHFFNKIALYYFDKEACTCFSATPTYVFLKNVPEIISYHSFQPRDDQLC